jgi:hypothetical protein
MSKRQSQPVIMPKRESNTLVIRATRKVAMGHQSHITGTGVHDNRPKRTRTRQAQRSAWQYDV